jgi:Fe-Mn family superoxide dismutase
MMKKYFLLILGIGLLAGCSQQESNKQFNTSEYGAIKLQYPYERADLPFGLNDLEPYMDAKTVDIHYNKHHKGYTDKLNAAIAGTDLEKKSLIEIFRNVSQYSDAVLNNSGGFYNHELFWAHLSQDGAKKPSGKLAEEIDKTFESFETFQKVFESTAASRFGSGWAWLSVDFNGRLFVSSTPNQVNPLMDVAEKQGFPILGIDVWEHAYYLLYQNHRPEYIKNFWNIVNWDVVTENYENALSAIGS